MISFKNLSIFFGNEILIKNISFSISKDDKIGLIGENGSGKTTLLSIILAELNKSDISATYSADVNITPDLQIAYFNQTREKSDKTLYEWVYDKNKKLEKLFLERQIIEREISSIGYNDIIGDRLIALEQEIAKNSEDKYEKNIEKTLLECGLNESLWLKSVDNLSGGEYIKASFAKLIGRKADITLLDEPTNHLDHESKKMVIEFMKKLSGAILVISHDRELLRIIPKKIFEIQQGKLNVFNGNYDDYESQKNILTKTQIRKIDSFHKERDRMSDTIERLKEMERRGADDAVIKLRMSFEKKLSRLIEENNELIDPRNETAIKLGSKDASRIGDYLVDIKNLKVSVGSKILYSNFNFRFEQKQKIFINAQNGRGKTTLLRLIYLSYLKELDFTRKLDRQQTAELLKLKELLSDFAISGEIKIGKTAKIGFFDQTDELDQDKTLEEYIFEITNQDRYGSFFNSILKDYKFTKDQIVLPLRSLSGGQRSRLKLLKIIKTNSNFLILDEPTNHLDIKSMNELRNFIDDFNGSIIGVSHDFDFKYGIDCISL